MSQTATGTTTRVQMRREGQQIVPHANLVSYDPSTGIFSALFDFQQKGELPYTFTPQKAPIADDVYADQNGLLWTLVR